MSATPKAPLWTGFFDKSGSPAIKIKISGPLNEGAEFDAILDTGFTGFISMPLIRAFPLGLLLYGTTSIELAAGSQSVKLTARGMAHVEGDKEVGVVILEPSSNDVLVGMAFLRIFKKALFVTEKVVVLIDETRTPEGVDESKNEEDILPPPPVDSN